MAIDKNSKAYQGLLAKGYTDEQITQMSGAVAGGQKAKDVVANTPTTTAQSDSYVYNPTSGYYEKPNTPTQPTQPTQQQTTPEVKQETETKQAETVGSTVPEIKQEGELKPLSQDYYNQTSDEAQSKIISNLNNYRQTNPEYFRDYESFKKNFSYDARNDEQKQTLDSWYGGYQKGMELAGIPVTDLYTQYKDGQVSMNELENLRVYDPTKYAELQAQINKGNIIAAYDDDKGVDTTGMSIQDMAYNMAVQTFNKFMSGDSSSGASQYFRDYEAKMESPEMLALSDQCTEVQEQMENIQSDLDSIKKSVEAEYEGTGATRSKINAIIADRSYDLQLQLRTLNSEYTKYATQYNNRMNQYQSEFQMQLQEYQLNQDARNQQMKELGFAMDLMNFETNEQKAQREWDYWVKQQEYTNGNINSKDYDTRYKAALKSVQNLLSQYEGIPMQRSAEQMADDILKAIDNGSDLGAELTKINKQIQGKPEYKKLYNATFGGSQGFGQTISIGGTDYVEYDGKLYTANDFNKQFGGGANYTVVSPDVLKTYSDGRAGTFGSFMANSKYDDGNYIGQCGKFVNDYLQSIGAGRLFGNETIDVRKKWINSDEGKVGTVAVFDYNHYIDGKNYGHVGIVISAPDKNGDFWVKDANFGSDGKIQTRKVNLKDVSLKGFIDPSLDQNGNRVSAGTSATLTSNSNGTTTTSTMTVGNLTPAQFDNYVKQYIDGEVNYSEVKAAFGDDGLAKVTERAAQLKEGGYERSKKITDPNKIMSSEQNLMTKFNSMNDGNKTALKWVDTMNNALNMISKDKRNDTKVLNGASQAIVTAYNKILDEKSVVRESEYARTPEGQAYLDKLEGKLEQFTKGGAGLTYENLKGLVDLANEFSATYQKQQDDLVQLIKNQADTYGLNIANILPMEYLDSGITTKTSPTAWNDGLNKSSDVFKLTTNIGGNRLPSNFYKK